MDGSRRGPKQARPQAEPPVPSSSRLNVRPKRNRRRPVSVWTRLPNRRSVIDACGRALRRAVPALVATAILAALGVGAVFGYRFVTTSPRFAITTIEVHGASRLADDGIRAALPVTGGENIFTTDLDDVTRTLRANPWIRSASAHRVLPHTLVVEIREHHARAVLQLGDALYLAGDDGLPFKRAAQDELADLPIITGISRDDTRAMPHDTAELVLQALDALTAWHTNPHRPDVGELHIDAHHALTLRTYDRGVAVQLGALRDVGERLATFDAVWAELTDAERERAGTLHLDARSDHVTVAFAKD